MTLPQISAPMGTWAAKNGIKNVITLVADYGPGNDAEAAFKKTFAAGGGHGTRGACPIGAPRSEGGRGNGKRWFSVPLIRKIGLAREATRGQTVKKQISTFLVHNLAIDWTRRRRTREMNYERLAGEAASLFAPAADPDERAFRAALTEALGELPIEQRAVVHLKLWEGLTFEAIAEALDLSPNTAASRYRYGLDKLRERLRPLYDEIT